MGVSSSHRRAGGGSVTAGQGYLVGERGPEWFRPGQNGGIVNNRDLMSIIPRAYDSMMSDIRTPMPSFHGPSGPSMSLRIENLSIGSDISRTEIEDQFRKMQVSIVRVVQSRVG